jgi:hypothetical protein
MNLLLVLAIGGVALYAVNQLTGIGKNIAGGFRNAGEALGSKLFDLFHPNPVGETLYYTVEFPDGRRHSIPSGTVNADGVFTWVGNSVQQGDGRRYRLLIDKRITSGVNKKAFPL